MGLLRTLLIILLVYYGLKLVARFALPLVMKRFMNNVEKKFNQQQANRSSDKQDIKVGETIIDKTPKQAQQSDKKVGDYIDFEEVD